MPKASAIVGVALFGILSFDISLGWTQVSGSSGIHDPSRIIKEGDVYHVFATGRGISHKTSFDLEEWDREPRILSPLPSWIEQEVPANDGNLWAPSILKHGDEYRLYYSVSSFGSPNSVIALATNSTLNRFDPNYEWVDQGIVVESTSGGKPYNAIDPSVMFDENTGKMWMTFGSFWGGIYISELDPDTGKPESTDPAVTNIARPRNSSAIEASYLHERDGYYYLFVNWGSCCQGEDSTYQIMVGRSESPTGPFSTPWRRTRMVDGGGAPFLGTEGDFIGPGHMSIFSENGTDYFGYHYYDGSRGGSARYNIERLLWIDDWPVPAFHVPEPSSLLLVLMGSTACLGRRSRKSTAPLFQNT